MESVFNGKRTELTDGEGIAGSLKSVAVNVNISVEIKLKKLSETSQIKSEIMKTLASPNKIQGIE